MYTMKLILTSKEKKCLEDSKRFKKSWDFYAIAKDSYLHGYEQALKDAAENWTHQLHKQVILATGSDLVEYETDSQQIGSKITDGVNDNG